MHTFIRNRISLSNDKSWILSQVGKRTSRLSEEWSHHQLDREDQFKIFRLCAGHNRLRYHLFEQAEDRHSWWVHLWYWTKWQPSLCCRTPLHLKSSEGIHSHHKYYSRSFCMVMSTTWSRLQHSSRISNVMSESVWRISLVFMICSPELGQDLSYLYSASGNSGFGYVLVVLTVGCPGCWSQWEAVLMQMKSESVKMFYLWRGWKQGSRTKRGVEELKVWQINGLPWESLVSVPRHSLSVWCRCFSQ